MSTEQLDGSGPAIGFAAMQGFNALSLLFLLQLYTLPDWLFVGFPFAVGLFAYWVVTRIYRSDAILPAYADDLNAAVPGIREYPLVYAYVLGTFVFFVGSIFVVWRGMA